jgi:hypothetical protein
VVRGLARVCIHRKQKGTNSFTVTVMEQALVAAIKTLKDVFLG